MVLRFILVLVLLCVGMTMAEAKRVALVMGNSAYQSFAALPNPVNDAKLMQKALEEVGFEVTLVLDADQAAMKRAMLEFGRTLRKGVDASIFYYAGHGVQVKGKNYLIPIEANVEDEDEVGVQTIDVNDFLETMESAKSPVNIVVLDACRNNPLNASRGGGGGLASVNAPRGSYIAYSTGPGRVAADGDGSNSPYTVALASVLVTPGLKLEDVFKKTREKVLASTADSQVPWETSSIKGDFYFKDGVAATSVVPAPANAAAEEWALVQHSNSKAVLEAFRDKYGSDLIYRGLAEEKLALLVPAKPTEPDCSGTLTTVRGVKTCLKTGDTFKDCDTCPEMVVVPAGSLMMGSPENEPDRQFFEGPQHKVTLHSAFAVGKFEVTRGQFAEFVENSNYKTGTSCDVGNGADIVDIAGQSFRDPGYKQTDNHPVVCVSWIDAQTYVKWLSRKFGTTYRLLSEAEWEYTNRAGTITSFPTGRTITTLQANFNTEKHGTTVVGQYEANGFGIHDMAGNAWEWTEDCFEDNYRNTAEKSNFLKDSDCKRVMRGGGWYSNWYLLRSAALNALGANDRFLSLGFRVARTL
jgi:formylglycine-generating enzyme required for sulfatase activity